MRILIVDDEVLARRRIRRLLAARRDEFVVTECRNGREAVAAIRDDPPDLVFLDVQMPELDGVGALREAGVEAVGAVIFVTAFDRYALKAFDLHAVDYLLKPFSDARFERALGRALGRIRAASAESLGDRLAALVADYQGSGSRVETSEPASPASVGRLTVRSGNRIRLVEVDDLDWIEASGSYVRLHTEERSWLLRESLSKLEARLGPPFVRIHRSTIVNTTRVVELLPLAHRELILVLRDGTRLKLSRSYRESAGPALGLES